MKLSNEKGQGLVEYALILVLVSIVVIAVLMLIGPKIGNTFSTIDRCLEIPGSSCSETYYHGGVPLAALSSEDYQLLRERLDRAQEVTERQEHALTEKIPQTVKHETQKTVQILLEEAEEEAYRTALEELLRQVKAGNLEAVLVFFSPESAWAEKLSAVSNEAKEDIAANSLKAREKVCREAINHGTVPFAPIFSDIFELFDKNPDNLADEKAILMDAWQDIVEPRNDAAGAIIEALNCNTDLAQ